ncbi:auxin efflux carrier [Neohortaea acidophila]|uniref:Auxin efflux carrier n=1 Tax=Neohortaea acidophila TaxID=245834 RepID=A0A6A6PNC7_9PEZI|nr:auxin efflux carrier [Neohortaea acidophila]KAF2480933.1 auxin efflux carrier [Neohortaea acidophila]
MPLFTAPTSFRLRQGAVVEDPTYALLHRRAFAGPQDHNNHPDFFNLAGLVSEAVLEVVFVALPGFLVAWTGMFDANSQKFVAELNVMVFTPCLIFTKLAAQLNADKLADLAVIPVIFIAQTIVSWLSAQAMSHLFGFGKKHKRRQKNFIIAMGVFGNSNSLPISLVISLANTIAGLHWDKIPGDNDNEVAARGILYLLIFQQLGQLLRWTWGYSVLLKPADAYEDDERDDMPIADRVTEEGRYRDDADAVIKPGDAQKKTNGKPTDSAIESERSATPISIATSSTAEEADDVLVPSSPVDTRYIENISPRSSRSSPHTSRLEPRARSMNHITTFPNFSQTPSNRSGGAPRGWTAPFATVRDKVQHAYYSVISTISTFFSNIFRRLPAPMQKVLSFLQHYNGRFWAGVWRQMNPPLWAMLAALVVASIPKLQSLFFTKGTLINNSVTRAIAQSGGVAVPLILVVLGANLARSTLPRDQVAETPAEKREERKLLFASLISRMIVPTIVMAPILALMAKYVPVSILDDPIFIIVCFLLTGAPSALQLAQICQINGVFMGAMSNLLVASYVVAIFPSTLTLVLLALEVVEWAVV